MSAPKRDRSKPFGRGHAGRKRFDKDLPFRHGRESCYPEIGDDLGKSDEAHAAAQAVDADWEANLPNVLFTHWKALEEARAALVAASEAESRLEVDGHSVAQCVPYTTEIATLVSQGLKLKRNIPVLVRPTGDDFVASFVEANVGSSGETLPEAVENLKSHMADVFKMLSAMTPAKLGPGPARQLAVLKEFIETPNG